MSRIMEALLKSITIVCQDEQFGQKIAHDVADLLDMYFADVNDILAYTLQDEKSIMNVCGVEYLDMLRSKCLSDISEYENAVIFMTDGCYIGFKNKSKFLDNTKVLYINFDEILLKKLQKINKKMTEEEKSLMMMQYVSRDELLKKYSHTIVNLHTTSKENAVNEVIKNIKEG